MFKSLISLPTGTNIAFMTYARRALFASAALVVVIAVFLIDEFGTAIVSRSDDPLVHIRVAGPADDGTAQLAARHAALLEEWFSEQLRAMGEKSLWRLSKDKPGARAYRFLVLPSFAPARAANLAVQADGSATGYVTVLTGAGASAPGRVKERTRFMVQPKQVRALDALFEQGGFWSSRIGVLERTDRVETQHCYDGVRYVLEAVSGGDYKLVTRHMCSIEDPVHTIMTALADLADIGPVERIDLSPLPEN